MPFIHEIQIVTSGYPGAPGYTNLYFESDPASDGAAQFAQVKIFLDAIAGNFPPGWSGQIAANGRILEATTGALGRFTTAPAGTTDVKLGIAAGTFGPGVAGLVIGWSTLTINRGRLVRGRTFLVPLARGAYDGDGTIEPGTIGGATLAANNLIAANVGFGVWSRPRLGVGGLLAVVTSARVNDKAAFLSSRRD